MRRAVLPGLIGAAMAITTLTTTASAQYKGKQRPFDTTSRRPSVSPYMNLVNNQTGQATNYQSLVRPQLDQQNYNAQSASAIKSLQRGQSKGSGSGGKSAPGGQNSKSSAEGNLKLRPTGHASSRENYSHFYPGLK
jgi:hypothetical protein